MDNLRFTLPALFADAVRVWRERAAQLWWIILTIVLPVTLMDMLGRHLDQSAYGDLTWLSLLLRYGSDFVLVIAWIMVLILTASHARGEERSMRTLLHEAGEHYIPGALTFFAAYVARAAGIAVIWSAGTLLPGATVFRPILLLIGVPLSAVIPMLWLSFAPFLAIIEVRPPFSAIRIGIQLAHRYWRKVAGVLLVLTILQGAVSLLFWWGGEYAHSQITAYALSSGLSGTATNAVMIFALLPIRIIDDVTMLFALTVFTLFFMCLRSRSHSRGEEEGENGMEEELADTDSSDG